MISHACWGMSAELHTLRKYADAGVLSQGGRVIRVASGPAHVMAKHAWAGSVPFRPGAQRTASIGLDASLTDNLCPFGAFRPEQRSRLLGCRADGRKPERRHFLFDVRQRDQLDDLAV